MSKQKTYAPRGGRHAVLEAIENFEDEDGYDSELDSNASLKEDAYMSNIFILQEMED